MPNRFNEFVHAENIRNFEKKLSTETDPENRRLLMKLLAEERERKLPHPADASEQQDMNFSRSRR